MQMPNRLLNTEPTLSICYESQFGICPKIVSNPNPPLLYSTICRKCDTVMFQVPISLFLSFKLKVLSFMNSESEKPKKISASKYAFLSKKVRNLSFDRATGNWYL